MTKERTFIAIKPDGVQRGYVAEIIGRFEKKGFKLVGLKQLIPSKDLAQNHYGVHKDRPFFKDEEITKTFYLDKSSNFFVIIFK